MTTRDRMENQSQNYSQRPGRAVFLHLLTLSIVVAMANVSLHEAQAVDVATIATITCPLSVSAKLNIENKIGSNPTLKLVSGDNLTITFHGEANRDIISWDGTEFKCKYKAYWNSGHSLEIAPTYTYDPKRKVLGCIRKSRTVLECRVH